MSTYQITELSIGRYSVPLWEGTALCQVDARYVPSILAAIESRKASFALPEGEEGAASYDGWCAQQVELLMSIGDRIIDEVRALRDGTDTPLEFQDPTLNPYTLPLASISQVRDYLPNITASVDTLTSQNLAKLDEVIAAIQASGGGQEDIGAALDTIIFLLGAL